MKYVSLGQIGQQVSEMCLGTMMFGDRCDEPEADRILSAAFERGVNFIDTAAMYAGGVTEEILGRIMRNRRDRLFLATKVHRGVDFDTIVSSIDESLKRLQTDYVDLYLIHWPQIGMQPEAIMRALNQVVSQGKARFVGCCNYPAWLVAHSNAIAERRGWPQLVCNQVPYNLLERGIEVELVPQAVGTGVALTVYRPLIMGLLAGKYDPDHPLPPDSRSLTDQRIGVWLERYRDGIRAFNAFAAERDLHPAQLALAWVRHSPGVTCPIVGVSSLKQLQPSIDAFEVSLTADEYQQLSAMFDTEVREEAGGRFPGLRRAPDLIGGH